MRMALEILSVDLKDERQAKMELQSTVGQLELEVKKLKADLHVSLKCCVMLIHI